MRKPGMSIHSEASFNESEAVGILKSTLESKHTIKTYFGENDRTPNHDGFFELTGPNQPPKKQFIVQIKKTENLRPESDGIHVGKYVYQLDTTFLYYVKEKVTENPAIYFVVDIASKQVFWIYLSDEKLMQLDFEGKCTIAYPFCENEIIRDMHHFTKQLEVITAQRNKMFLNKTAAQIAEMQDAADYINRALDYELPFVKEALFPRLWRFGIKCTNTSDLFIEVQGRKYTPPVSSLMALYPQIKGVKDTGLQEYSFDATNVLNQIEIGQEGKPLDYCKQALQKILQSFFEGRIPVHYLPDIALKELISAFQEESNPLFDGDPANTININAMERRYCYLANYAMHLMYHDATTTSEKQIKQYLARHLSSEKNHISLASMVLTNCGKESFREYCLGKKDQQNIFNPFIFSMITYDYIQYFFAIQELKRRSIIEFEPIWNYDLMSLRMLPIDEYNAEVNAILDHWLGELPAVYEETYSKMIHNDKYRFNGKYVYSNVGERQAGMLAYVSSIVHYYKSPILTISKDNNITNVFTEKEQAAGLKGISSGRLFNEFLDNKTLFYDGISCLLYNGVCKGFNFESKPLHVHNDRFMRTGLSLFDGNILYSE